VCPSLRSKSSGQEAQSGDCVKTRVNMRERDEMRRPPPRSEGIHPLHQAQRQEIPRSCQPCSQACRQETTMT
jgi:hypothetical protein